MAITSPIYPLKKVYRSIVTICIILGMFSVANSQETNNAEEWLRIGNKYFHGENGNAKDYFKAFEYFEKAAKMGLSAAEYNLGVMFLNGYGCTINPNEAIRWFTKAAEQNDPHAQYNLGIMYRDGFEETKNHYEAIGWFRKAANQGDVDSQIELGSMLLKYFPRSKYDEAVSSYKKAAEQGNTHAQQYLGYLYILEKKYEEALKWSLTAAKEGNSKAQGNLGRMYLYGQGVEQSYIQAYMWFTIASHDNDEFMQSVEKRLSKNDIVQAKKMAIEWEKENLIKYKPQ